MASAKPLTAQPPTLPTTPPINRRLPRAFPFLSPPVTAARQAGTIASPKQLTATPSTPSPPHPTTSPFAAQTLPTPTPAPMPPIGIRPTHPRFDRLFPTSQKSPGMIPARARQYQISRASARLTVQPAYVTTPLSAHFCKPRSQVAAVLAPAPPARLPSAGL